MKKRRRFACFMQLLFGLALCSGRAAFAQVNTEEEFDILFERGSKAAEKDNFEQTIAAWIPAYRIKAHYKIACGIGRLALRLERLVEAATWLNRCRLSAPPPKTDEGIARRGIELIELEVAKAHLISATVQAESGAAIFANGEEMGIAPLKAALFFAPGKNTIEARKDGKSIVQAFEGERGEEMIVPIKSAMDAAPPSPAPALPPSTSTAGNTKPARVVLPSAAALLEPDALSEWISAWNRARVIVGSAALLISAPALGFGASAQRDAVAALEDSDRFRTAAALALVRRDTPGYEKNLKAAQDADHLRVAQQNIATGLFVLSGVFFAAGVASFAIGDFQVSTHLTGAQGSFVW